MKQNGNNNNQLDVLVLVEKHVTTSTYDFFGTL